MVTKYGRSAGRVSEVDALPAPERKHDYIRDLFDAIAPRYDLLNSLLSWRLHHRWRRVAADQASLHPGDAALDVCTGTGDLAFELARRVGPDGTAIGTDYSLSMLRLGREKASRPNRNPLSLALADTQSLPFPDSNFDAVTVAFGIRNVADTERGIREMARVTKKGGRVILLEFNRPRNPLIATLYRLYSFAVMPALGGLISGRRSAYAYLPASVESFASRDELSAMMRRAGLGDIRITDLNLGTVVIHRGVKLQ